MDGALKRKGGTPPSLDQGKCASPSLAQLVNEGAVRRGQHPAKDAASSHGEVLLQEDMDGTLKRKGGAPPSEGLKNCPDPIEKYKEIRGNCTEEDTAVPDADANCNATQACLKEFDKQLNQMTGSDCDIDASCRAELKKVFQDAYQAECTFVDLARKAKAHLQKTVPVGLAGGIAAGSSVAKKAGLLKG